MIRKINFKRFYDEIVEALDCKKAFNLVFEGSEADLNKLKKALKNATVTIIELENKSYELKKQKSYSFTVNLICLKI